MEFINTRLKIISLKSRKQKNEIDEKKSNVKDKFETIYYKVTEKYADIDEFEFDEFKEAVKEKNKIHMEEEFGDILFAVVNLARWNKIDAEQALITSNTKFEKRFRKMEELATKPLTEYSFEEFDLLWKQAKRELS